MLSTLIANIPISINGIGLMDGSFIYLISKFGVDYDAAIIVMLIQRGLTIAVSLFGGIFYLSDKNEMPDANAHAKTLKNLKESL
jgi:hypothetical protein